MKPKDSRLVHSAGCAMLFMAAALAVMIAQPEESPIFTIALFAGWGIPVTVFVFLADLSDSVILLLSAALAAVTLQFGLFTWVFLKMGNVVGRALRASHGSG
jgi:hypothetical protein